MSDPILRAIGPIKAVCMMLLALTACGPAIIVGSYPAPQVSKESLMTPKGVTTGNEIDPHFAAGHPLQAFTGPWPLTPDPYFRRRQS